MRTKICYYFWVILTYYFSVGIVLVKGCILSFSSIYYKINLFLPISSRCLDQVLGYRPSDHLCRNVVSIQISSRLYCGIQLQTSRK